MEGSLVKISAFGRSWRNGVMTTASTLALCALVAQPALAQDAAEDAVVEEVEPEGEIIVDGYRKALENAQNLKRDADTFVDAITAEDIGALPDRSVAEALQRVPGVNIGRFEKTTDPDRFSVEGTGVIIRGLSYGRAELNANSASMTCRPNCLDASKYSRMSLLILSRARFPERLILSRASRSTRPD
jgi:hypothetical protein